MDARARTALVVCDELPLPNYAGHTTYNRAFIQALKEALKAIDGRGIREGFEVIRSGRLPTYERALVSEDSKEGVRAFSEKRKAVFRGR